MIELEHLTKRFDAVLAVDQISLTVPAGEILALVGPNGAGKTTTVRMLSAILKPTAGKARVAGYDTVTQASDVRRNVGLLTEAPGLYTRMSGREYLDFFGEIRGLSVSKREKRIQDLADWFHIGESLDRRLGEYSRGMRQKIVLVRTLLHEPPVLLFDEPTSTLDPLGARLVRDTILQLRDGQRAIVICTHNLPEAEELADRIAIIRRGRIVELGTPAELKTRLLGFPLLEVRFAPSAANGAATVVSQFAAVEADGAGWVHYRAEQPEQTNPLILRALLEADMPVISLQEVPRSLESVYLRVIAEGV